jgi:uncharacterized iron-sulfur protein MMP1067
MTKLTNFKDDINKCSKCGLCQSVCPIYKITGNDCAVSRGKFVMLDGVLKGDLKLNKNIDKYLDMCLKCGKCTNFCPSAIDVCKIFETAKYEYTKNTLLGKIIFLMESKYVFGTFLNFFKILTKPFRKKRQKKSSNSLKVIYFKGCVNNLSPKTDNYLEKLFRNFDVEIIEKDFDCCGLPFLSSGNLERFEEVKQHNLKMLDCDFDYILTDCASCESTLKQYMNAEFISIGELIEKLNIKFEFPKPIKVTFHKPCHLENDKFLEPLLKNCENVEYVKMDDYDDCCGLAGEFALKNPKLSKQISDKKAENILNTNADYVITTCPGCILGLYQGLITKKNPPKPVSLTDFLSKAKINNNGKV